MKTLKQQLFWYWGLCVWCCMQWQAQAQHTAAHTHLDKHFFEGQAAYVQKQYGAAAAHFKQYLDNKPTGEQIATTEYYLLLIALYENQPDIEAKLQHFINTYPTYPQTADLYAKVGSFYFSQQNYDKALYFYEKNTAPPSTTEQYESLFQQGYIYFSRNEYAKALPVFEQTKLGQHDYLYASAYYVGYMYYVQDQFGSALENLERASYDAIYRKESNKIIPIIYYKQNKYKELVEFLKKVEADGEYLSNNQLLLMADAYYYEKEYLLAAKYYDIYYANVGERTDRKVFFKMAYALGLSGDTNKAIQAYATVAEGADSLAQVAAFNMGLLYVQADQKQPAVNAFERAKSIDLDRNIQEEAFLNYVKLNFDLKDFPTTITACNMFMETFPNSPHEDEVNELLTNSYLNSGDYLQALGYIEQIANKNYKLRLTYQRLAFNKAVEYYNTDLFKEAEQLLRKSLLYPVNQNLAASSYYWLGEIYSYEQAYDSALWFYGKIPSSAPEYKEALYGKAYAAYNRKDYGAAAQLFRQYLNQGKNETNQTDAEIRLADCYYVQKQYDDALNLYDKTLRIVGADVEYLYFQKAMTLANTAYLDEAHNTFDYLISNYPQSKYIAPALYHKALLYFNSNQKANSVTLFGQIIIQHAQSSYVPDALLKRAIAYQLLNEQEKAMADYVQLVQQFPTHRNAEDAIQALQELQSNGYSVNGYDGLADNFVKSNPNSKAAVEGEFAAAKVFYDNGDYKKAVEALHRFTKKYTDNNLTPEAYYFLAMSYDQQNDYENALFAYSRVKGDYEIRALLRAGEIEQQRSNYAVSMQKYEATLKGTPNKRYEGTALAGLVVCYFQLKNYEKSQEYTQQLIAKNHTKLLGLAELYQGRILAVKGDTQKAFTSLQKVAQNYPDNYGAEAQYEIGAILRQQQRYEESTKALIEVKNKFATYRSWLYEAFLLIAANYLSQGNKFQAKATLQSIIDNATDEKIRQRATKELNGL